MNVDYVSAALRPSIEMKESSFARGEEVLPLLLFDTGESITMLGLAIPKQDWPRAFFQAAKELGRAESLILVVDARVKLLQVDEVLPDGGLAVDPTAGEAMIALGVDSASVVQVAVPYTVGDDGKLVWEDEMVSDEMDGEMVDVLRAILQVSG